MHEGPFAGKARPILPVPATALSISESQQYPSPETPKTPIPWEMPSLVLLLQASRIWNLISLPPSERTGRSPHLQRKERIEVLSSSSHSFLLLLSGGSSAFITVCPSDSQGPWGRGRKV